jgi:hypothetical protein
VVLTFSRVLLRSDILWLTLNQAQIIQCLSLNIVKKHYILKLLNVLQRQSIYTQQEVDRSELPKYISIQTRTTTHHIIALHSAIG